MIVYFIVSIIIIIISSLKIKNERIQLLLCFSLIFVLMAFRTGWTADYFNYEEIFDVWSDMSFAEYIVLANFRFEIASFAIFKILPSYRIVIIVQSLLYILAMYVLFYKFIPRKYYTLAFVLWLYNAIFFESFNALRSTFVISLFIFAFYYKNKGLKYLPLLLVLLSTQFHMSGYFMIPIILIPNDFLWKHFKLFSTSLVVVVFVILFLPSFFIGLLTSLTDDEEGSFAHYSNYVGTGSYGLGFFIFVFFRILFIAYLMYLVRKGILDRGYSWVVTVVIIYFVLNCMPDIPIIYRFNCYFRPFLIMLSCHILYKDKSKLSKIYIALMLIYMFLTFKAFFSHHTYEEFYLNYRFSIS